MSRTTLPLPFRLVLPACMVVLVCLAAPACSRPQPSDVEPHTATAASRGASPTKRVAAATPNGKRETAILAGGCFWGMEELLRKIPGVIATDVGYTGGTVSNPRYSDVKGGRSGHAEAVR